VFLARKRRKRGLGICRKKGFRFALLDQGKEKGIYVWEEGAPSSGEGKWKKEGDKPLLAV